MKLEKIDPAIKKCVKSIINAYYFWEQQAKQEDMPSELKEQCIFFLNKIEGSFEDVVNEKYKTMVWNYIFKKELPPEFWQKYVNEEINKWEIYLAKELFFIKK